LTAQAGVKACHQQSGGHALATDVANRDTQAVAAVRRCSAGGRDVFAGRMPSFGQRAITDIDEVVVVAADCLGGSAVDGHLYARNVWERLREQTLLHLAGNLEFAFQLMGLYESGLLR
jgi:hypothetical protein